MSTPNSDSDNRIALGLIFAIVLLSAMALMGFGIYKGVSSPAAQDEEVIVVVPVEVDADNAARVVVEQGVVKFFFATAKSDLATGANEALAATVTAVQSGQRAVISGYTDATGDADKNAALAKQRAEAVRDALLSLGVPQDQIELRKPEALVGSGDNTQARRVEVTLAP